MTESTEEVTTVRVLGKRETQRAARVLALEAIIDALEVIDYASVREIMSASALEETGFVNNDDTGDEVAEAAWAIIVQVTGDRRNELELAASLLDAPLRSAPKVA